jgi:16S rRNA processing protein RimM
MNVKTVVIGQIGAPYGVKGWMHVRSFLTSYSNLEGFSNWKVCLKSEEESKLIQVEKFKAHNDHYVAKLMNIEDRTTAASFTNWQIAIERDVLPELATGEYYCADLLGMAVYNKDGSNLGTVVDILATGANDVLIVRNDSKENLIPYVMGTYILKVCLDRGEMQVAWDEGF